jgi:hypothetical protein
MKKAMILSMMVAFFLAGPALSADFKVYPGAKLDDMGGRTSTKGEAEAKAKEGRQPLIYVTPDSFEKVVAFYKEMAKEYRMAGKTEKPRQLPSGQEVKETYFIFDGARDLMASKLWIKIQRPYISMGKMESKPSKPDAAREMTAIIVAKQQ